MKKYYNDNSSVLLWEEQGDPSSHTQQSVDDLNLEENVKTPQLPSNFPVALGHLPMTASHQPSCLSAAP